MSGQSLIVDPKGTKYNGAPSVAENSKRSLDLLLTDV